MGGGRFHPTAHNDEMQQPDHDAIAMRSAASKLGFDANVVISEGEADIVNEVGIVMGGCYVNEEGHGYV